METEQLQSDHQSFASSSQMTKKRRRMVIGFTLVLIIVAAGLWVGSILFNQGGDIRQRASTQEPELSMETHQPLPYDTSTPNITINIQLDSAGKALTAAALKLQYDPTVLQYLNAENSNGFSQVLKGPEIDQSTGTITYILGVQATQEIFTGKKAVAAITFKPLKPANPATVTFDKSFSAATELGNTSPNVVINYKDASFVINQGGGSTPSPSPTPNPTGPLLSVSFPLQGLNKPDQNVPMEIAIRYMLNGQKKVDIYEAVGKSNADKQVVLPEKIRLDKLPSGYQGTVEVLVKPKVALREKLGEAAITSTTPEISVASTKKVRVGDFLQGERGGVQQTNLLEVADLVAFMRLLTDTSVPVTDATRMYDVTYDGILDEQDMIVTFVNFTDTTIRGEEL